MVNPKRWFALLSVLVSVGLICWLLSSIDPTDTARLLAESDRRWLLLALILTSSLPFLNTFRWLGVLSAQDEICLPYGKALRGVMMALVLNSFMPSKSGDLAKAYYLRDHGGLTRGVGTVILERLVDLFMLGLLGVVGFTTSGITWGLSTGLFLITAVLSLLTMLTLLPINLAPGGEKVRNKLTDFRQVFRNWTRAPQAILRTCVSSLASWLVAGSIVGCLAHALHTALRWDQSYAIYPLSVLAGLMPSTISGLGTRDAAFRFLLTDVGLNIEQATLIGFGYTFFVYWLLSAMCLPMVLPSILQYFRSKTESVK